MVVADDHLGRRATEPVGQDVLGAGCGELGGERLADDQVAVRHRGLEELGASLDRQADPVADVTSELATEGLARDLVRAVQQARRDTGLHVSDRISLTIQGGAEVFEATVTHRDLIVGETLATQFASGPTSPNSSTPAAPVLPGAVDVVVGDNQPATILVVKR